MTKHVAKMMDGNIFSTAVVMTDVVLVAISLGVAIAAHLV